MKKLIFTKWIHLFIISLLIISCREDKTTEIETQKNNSNLISKVVDFTKSKPKNNIAIAIQEAKEHFKNKKKSADDFSIDMSHVIQMQNGNYHTYTFRINRSNSEPNKVENLVLSLQPDNTYKQYINTYTLSLEEQNQILQGEDINLTADQISSYPLNTNNGTNKWVEEVCHVHTVVVREKCGNGNYHWNPSTTLCVASKKAVNYIVQVETCTDVVHDDGNDDLGGGDVTPPSGGGGGGSTGGVETPINCVIPANDPNFVGLANGDGCTLGVPTLPNLGNRQFMTFIDTLPTELKTIIYKSENQNYYQGLSNYFTANNGSQETKDFITWALQFKQQNPNITWEHFENWFVEGESLSSSEMQDFLSDLINPDRVKPTRRFKRNAKLNSVYNEIKNAANFKQYLQNFEPSFSVAHLIFDVGTLNDVTAQAETTEPISYNIKIKFNKNTDWNTIPRIVVANTFMHEMIHAEIYRKLLSLASTNGNINTNEVQQMLNEQNYSGLYDYYVKRTVGDDNWQHEMMAAHYIDIMVNFLKQVYGSQYSDFDYKTVVWMSSLKGTKAWDLLPSNTKQQYINNWNTKYYLWEI